MRRVSAERRENVDFADDGDELRVVEGVQLLELGDPSRGRGHETEDVALDTDTESSVVSDCEDETRSAPRSQRRGRGKLTLMSELFELFHDTLRVTPQSPK